MTPEPPPEPHSPLPRPRASLRAKVALAIGVVLLYVGGLELWLSLAHEEPPHERGPYDDAYVGIFRPSDDPILREELVPGANGVVNEHGYVGTSYPPEKPSGVYRILGLGDSITMYRSAERQGYLLLAEERLRREPGLAPVEVLNFGVASYDTPREVRLLELRGLAFDPDLVVVGYCINDAIDFVFAVNEMTGRVVFRPEDHQPLEVIRFLERSVSTAGASVTPDALFEAARAQDTWAESMRALAALDAIAEREGFEVVLLVFPVLVAFDRYPFEPVHEALRARAAELGFHHLDLLPHYRAAASAETLADDVIHPNPVGHRIAADALAQRILELGLVPRAP